MVKHISEKYLPILRISFQQEIAYRANFVIWRIRNILQVLLVFYLWDTVFSEPGTTLFGYNRTQILTYVFGVLIVRSFVLSTRALDVAGEIANGGLTNYLLKPVSYFWYWLTRDLASKLLNLGFSAVEFLVLYYLIKPEIFVQQNPVFLAGFLVSMVLALLLFFVILFITSSVPFWYPEIAWGAQFLVIAIVTEFLSGAVFPLDILPDTLTSVLSYTPFPYLIYYPIKVYLGQVSYLALGKGLAVAVAWLFALFAIKNYIWKKGLLAYRAEGR